MPQFQLNCIDAQDDCLICLTKTMGLSVHLISHEQFNLNQVINLANYSSLGNFTDKPNTDFFLLYSVEVFQIMFFKIFSSSPRVMSQQNFKLSKCFSNLKATGGLHVTSSKT